MQVLNMWRWVITAVSASCFTPTKRRQRRRTAAARHTTTSCRWDSAPPTLFHRVPPTWHHTCRRQVKVTHRFLVSEVSWEGADQSRKEEGEEDGSMRTLISYSARRRVGFLKIWVRFQFVKIWHRQCELSELSLWWRIRRRWSVSVCDVND